MELNQCALVVECLGKALVGAAVLVITPVDGTMSFVEALVGARLLAVMTKRRSFTWKHRCVFVEAPVV